MEVEVKQTKIIEIKLIIERKHHCTKVTAAAHDQMLYSVWPNGNKFDSIRWNARR